MNDRQLIAFLAAATALRWAAEDLLTARQCFSAAGLTDQSEWLLTMSTQLTDLAHDICPLPTTEDS